MNKLIGNITKSNKKTTILNVILSLAYEIVFLVHGLIVPRLILGAFGSETNGLVSSITQFLGLITILEGGVGGVVKAALYKPLANNDNKKLSAVFNSAKSFYQKLALIYAIYGALLAILYPLIFRSSFDWYFVFALVLIIAFQTFIQYFFSLTYRVLIVADRKGFVVSIVSILIQILSLGLSIFIVSRFPNLILLKGASILLFAVQPFIYGAYVKKHYSIDKHEPQDQESLKQRWDGFGHNLAYFIHSNTDVVLLTIFCSFSDVSIYSVYFMIVSALRTLVSSVSTSIAPTMGNILTKGTEQEKNNSFDIFSFSTNTISTISFTCGIVLITPFVLLYTKDITDANYFHPWLGYLLILAEYIYCLRGPYVETAYSSGHFKQTAKFAYIEASLNIVVSIILLKFIGVEGVAVGTLVAMTYRWIMHILYLRDNILFRPLKKSIVSFCTQFFSLGLTFFITYFIKIRLSGYFGWFVYAMITGVISILSLFLLNLLLDRKTLFLTYSKLFKRN